MGNDPSAHIAHDLPLADRLIGDAVMAWLNRHTETVLAATASVPVNDRELCHREGIDHLRQSLDDYWYTLVPGILSELRRAGLMARIPGPPVP